MTVATVNRQRTKKINARLLKQIAKTLLAELQINEAELGINLVAATEMARVNETFLNHTGSTDVITFNHADRPNTSPSPVGRERAGVRVLSALHGEVFICVEVAVSQAKQFQTTWQSEVVRYLTHGVLHLLGHDDHRPIARRKMKREENRLLRLLAKEFPLARLAR